MIMIMIMIDYNWLMTLGEVALSTMLETTANDDAKSTSMPFTLTMRSCFWTWKMDGSSEGGGSR